MWLFLNLAVFAGLGIAAFVVANRNKKQQKPLRPSHHREIEIEDDPSFAGQLFAAAREAARRQA